MPKNSEKCNHARKFNGIMPYVHQKWVAKVLCMEQNPERGPDLLGNGCFAEVKFLLRNPINYNQSAWTIQDHQVEYTDYWTGQGFWTFGFYNLKQPVSEIKTTDQEELELFVKQRELFVIPWSWAYQFPSHNCTGETHQSKWNNHFRYAKISALPKIKSTHKVRKGLVHLTERVPEYMFDF